MRSGLYCFILFIAFFSVTNTVIAQIRLQGTVVAGSDDNPVPFASVFIYKKGFGSMTDSTGKFTLKVPKSVNLKDSIVISAIGYEAIKVPVEKAVRSKKFTLNESAAELENIVVISSIRGNMKSIDYYRGWNVKDSGSEIGQMFYLPKKNMKLEKVQAKINQNYDSCRVKLHLRKMTGGYPGEEILKDSVFVLSQTKMGILEFDLSDKNIELDVYEVYVGFEVTGCYNPLSQNPSFSFMGIEHGKNFYRTKPGRSWEVSNEYTILVRISLR